MKQATSEEADTVAQVAECLRDLCLFLQSKFDRPDLVMSGLVLFACKSIPKEAMDAAYRAYDECTRVQHN